MCRSTIEKAHIIHLGMGGNRAKGRGRGCNCPVNILYLSPYYHDVLDGRIRDASVEYVKASRKSLLKEPKSWRHILAFGVAFGYTREIRKAIKHHKERKDCNAK